MAAKGIGICGSQKRKVFCALGGLIEVMPGAEVIRSRMTSWFSSNGNGEQAELLVPVPYIGIFLADTRRGSVFALDFMQRLVASRPWEQFSIPAMDRTSK